mmetsp:Transcript_39335/g.80246  ORF Transcript_39335/g.80246 Transcript_39335/m.80246 type:complete len:81 (+) Transcript_39335:251-493(+)
MGLLFWLELHRACETPYFGGGALQRKNRIRSSCWDLNRGDAPAVPSLFTPGEGPPTDAELDPPVCFSSSTFASSSARRRR